MGRYDDLLYQLIKKNLRNCFEKPVDSNIKVQIEKYSGMPDDYIDFLREIGYGDIGEGYFIIYSVLVEPSDMYDTVKANKLRDILFLGDDYKGHSIGFENSGVWELIEVDGMQKVTFLNISFEEFIRNKIADYINCLEKY